MKALKIIRVTLAILFLASITWLFLDFTGLARLWVGWMAKVQLLPAILALNLGAVALVIGLTLLLGRVYCSIICPLGVTQDCFTWLRGRVGSKRGRHNRFMFSPSMAKVRVAILVGFVAMFAIGGVCSVIASLIEPYSAFGRIASSLGVPIYDKINNLLAARSEAAGDYNFYHVDAAMAWSPIVTTIAIATLIIVGGIAFFKGRAYCNTVCPVGTLLGLISKFSLFKIRIDTDKCVNCGKCARNCKASCIDAANHHVDYTKCVACMDCLDQCSVGAIKYSLPRQAADTPTTDKGRRKFMATGAVIAGSALLAKAQKVTDGGLAPLREKRDPERDGRLSPAGSLSWKHLADHCTRCQLCINQCPNNVLSPSSDLSTLMMPMMSYVNGYCRPECNTCSTVCPTGSIKPITVEQRAAISIGVAHVDPQLCVSAAKGVDCGNCARHCPSQAITMVPVDKNNPAGHWRPAVNESLCLGCGACENLCPVAPISAITVTPRQKHVEI